MLKHIALLLLAALVSPVVADETSFWLVKDGKPACTIVLPDKPVTPDKATALPEHIDDYRCQTHLYGRIERAAKTLREDVHAFTGAELPIVTESEKPTGKMVLIGATAQTLALGLNDTDLLAKNYVVIRASDNQLILNGRVNAYIDNESRRYVRSYSGAAAAVYHFMERHLGISHFAPGKVGREYPPPTKNLSVPSNLNVQFTPSIRFGGEIGEIFDYHDYNRGSKHGSFLTYGGHSWIYQVPPEIYFDQDNHPETYHPEYYALVNGRRITDAEHGGSLCTEHPDVLRISVENIGKVFDAGVDVVELGQADSYDEQTACQCDACMKVGDTSPQGLGARITKFHTAIARELLKTHPDKFVLHLLYGASYFIPKDFKGPLPKNMMLQYADWGSDDFKKIEAFAHLEPAGITVYLYTFTGFNPLGYGGPKTSVTDIKNLFQTLKKHRVQYIYWCGRADANFGMEGPAYWLAQQLQWDYNQDPDLLMETYWKRYYKQAAAPMKRLYEAIDSRKIAAIEELEKAYNGSSKAYARYVYPTIFNRELNAAVDACFDQAKRLVDNNDTLLRRIGMVEASYRFNRMTADCFKARDAFESDKTIDNLTAWRSPLNARNAFVADLEKRWKTGGYEDFYVPVIPVSAFYNNQTARRVSVYGLFNVGDRNLLNRSVRHMKGFGIHSAVAQPFDTPPTEESWTGLDPVNRSPMLNNENGENVSANTVVKTGWDKQNIYVHFECEEPTGTLHKTGPSKRDDDLESTDAVEVVVTPTNERGYPMWSQCKRFTVNAAGIMRDVRIGYDRHAPDDTESAWNGQGTASTKERLRSESWTATLAIPWTTIDGMPPPDASGKRMVLMNFIRYRPARAGAQEAAVHAWMPTFGDVANPFRCGEITLRANK